MSTLRLTPGRCAIETKPLRTEQDCDAALGESEALLGCAEDSPQSDRLEVLTALVESFEKRRYWLTPPTAVEAIRFRLDQLGKTEDALVGIIGDRDAVKRTMRGESDLTVSAIRRLQRNLEIPAEALI